MTQEEVPLEPLVQLQVRLAQGVHKLDDGAAGRQEDLRAGEDEGDGGGAEDDGDEPDADNTRVVLEHALQFRGKVVLHRLVQHVEFERQREEKARGEREITVDRVEVRVASAVWGRARTPGVRIRLLRLSVVRGPKRRTGLGEGGAEHEDEDEDHRDAQLQHAARIDERGEADEVDLLPRL